MYKNIFDTHAHYDSSRFDEDRDALISSLCEKGVSHIINCGCDLESSIASVELTEKYGFVYAAVGVHPHEAEDTSEEKFKEIERLYKNKRVVAVGEIGLDYHYDFSPREIQLDFFEKQLILADKLSLPVIMHDREAHEDTMRLLTRYKPKGVVHCFSGSVEMAKEIIKLGMYIGLGGAVTFKNARKPVEVAEYVPLDRLLLETDAPYLSPEPKRGKANNSSLIIYVAEALAEIKGIPTEEVLRITKQNAEKLFGFQ